MLKSISYVRFSIAYNSTKIEEIFDLAFFYTCLLQVGSQKNYRRMFKRNVLPYLASSSQIWLNIFLWIIAILATSQNWPKTPKKKKKKKKKKNIIVVYLKKRPVGRDGNQNSQEKI